MFKNEEWADTTRKSGKEESDMLSLEVDGKEIRERKGVKMLTPKNIN